MRLCRVLSDSFRSLVQCNRYVGAMQQVLAQPVWLAGAHFKIFEVQNKLGELVAIGFDGALAVGF